jgi:hypothetical protein
MKASKQPAPIATFGGALRNLGKGLYNLTARFAGYNAAHTTSTTRVGSRFGTNPNSTVAAMQRVGMNWTAEDVFKNSCIAAAYILQRVNYCSATMIYVPNTGDKGLDAAISEYLQGKNGDFTGGVFGSMGVDCSMQDAFSRTADIETPIRGDAGLIFNRDPRTSDLRIVEFSADQLGYIYEFTLPRVCGLAYDSDGMLKEVSGRDTVYYAGRYFQGCDCVAYKILERTNAFYANPVIYPAHDVVYFRDPSSFRGVRGITKFATAILHMEKGETLFQAGLNSAIRQSKTAMIIKNERGAPDEGSYDDDDFIDGRIGYRERIPEGPLTEYFYNGDDANFVVPNAPGDELIQGVETSDERVALALGMNYAFLISATKVGGAPSRLEINKASSELSRIKRKIHTPKAHRIKDVTLLDAANRNILPHHPNLLRGRWVFPISPTVDAFYDVKENIAMSRAGFESPQDIIAETNRDAMEVLEQKKAWSIACAIATQDANKELRERGYEPTIQGADIAQVSDNPQQAAAAQNLEEGKPASGVENVSSVNGRMSAYMGDMRVKDLPEATRNEIARILGTNGSTGELSVIKYGMTVPELLSKVDTHNMQTARKHMKYIPSYAAREKVDDTPEKHILLMNGNIVDGHHFLATAEKGKVTKSLPVIDLTPTRFQTGKLSEFDESKHPRTGNGEFGGGSGTPKAAKYNPVSDNSPVIDLDEKPHIQRFEQLYSKDLAHDLTGDEKHKLSDSEESELDNLHEKIAKEFGSFRNYDKQAKLNTKIKALREHFSK